MIKLKIGEYLKNIFNRKRYYIESQWTPEQIDKSRLSNRPLKTINLISKFNIANRPLNHLRSKQIDTITKKQFNALYPENIIADKLNTFQVSNDYKFILTT
jgi:hypothetical protein